MDIQLMQAKVVLELIWRFNSLCTYISMEAIIFASVFQLCYTNLQKSNKLGAAVSRLALVIRTSKSNSATLKV